MNRPDPADYLKNVPSEGEEYDRAIDRYNSDWKIFQSQVDAIRKLSQILIHVDEIDLDLIAFELSREHRTHQQCAGRGVVKILQAMAVLDYDGRNEATVKMAQTACAAISRIYLPYI